jgi:hypothetical protein
MATERRTKDRRERVESETVEVDGYAESSAEVREADDDAREPKREVEVTEHRVIVNRP